MQLDTRTSTGHQAHARTAAYLASRVGMAGAALLFVELAAFAGDDAPMQPDALSTGPQRGRRNAKTLETWTVKASSPAAHSTA
jgi:hypothetical protein